MARLQAQLVGRATAQATTAVSSVLTSPKSAAKSGAADQADLEIWDAWASSEVPQQVGCGLLHSLA